MTVTTPTGALCPFFISRKHTKHTKKGRNPVTARLCGCVSVTQEYTKHTKWDAGICVFCAFLFFDTQPARYATTGFSVFFVCFVPFWVFSDLSKQITPPPPFWLASLPLSNRTTGSPPLSCFRSGNSRCKLGCIDPKTRNSPRFYTATRRNHCKQWILDGFAIHRPLKIRE